MVFSIGDYILDINIEQNRRYYSNKAYVTDCCTCDGCQNYEKAVDGISTEVKSLFHDLGVDIKKPAEVYVNCSHNGFLCYGGFYHIIGTIIKGQSPWVKIKKSRKTTISHLDENKMHSINEFKIAFQSECSLLNKELSLPYIQMEIIATLSWIMDKINIYES